MRGDPWADRRVWQRAFPLGATVRHRWIVVADSPFLPAHGGGEREHLGFVRAAVEAGLLQLLVVPSAQRVDERAYRRILGDAGLLVTPRRTSPLRLAHPTRPYVVASRPAPRWLTDRARQPAAGATGIVLFSYKSRRIGEVLGRDLGLPVVLRQHNREGAYHRSLAADTPGPRGWALRWDAARIERDERRLGRAPWLTGIADISLADAAWRRRAGARNVDHVPPFAIDPAQVSTMRGAHVVRRSRWNAEAGGPADQVPRVLFLGALDVATNVSALAWFIGGVWPLVRAAHPDAQLDVVGRGPSRSLVRRLEGEPGVHLHADVPEVEPYLERADVAVNPAVSGSGVNIKLVECLAAAIPTVSTSSATRGLPLLPGRDLEVRDTVEGFADATCGLIADPVLARTLGRTGRAHVCRLLDPAVNLARLADLFPVRR